MSCSGCRILRRGCSQTCILRPCLQWIQTAEEQGNATVFVAKFFGRAALMSFIAAVPENQRPAVFQSMLYEAAGRTVNPVNGAVGLLWTGNWHVCQAAVESVLRGIALKPIQGSECRYMFNFEDCGVKRCRRTDEVKQLADADVRMARGFPRRLGRSSVDSYESVTTSCRNEPVLLNLFI